LIRPHKGGGVIITAALILAFQISSFMVLFNLRRLIGSLLAVGRTLAIAMCALMLGACANLDNSRKIDAVSDAVDDARIRSVVNGESGDEDQKQLSPELILPKLELSEELLADLIVASLASHNEQWSVAAAKTFSAAQASNDPRLARLASLYAMQDKDYARAVEAAKHWVQLNTKEADAQITLLLAHLSAGEAEPAFEILQSRQAESSIEEFIKDVAGILVQQSNADVAIEIMSKYSEQSPASPQVALSSAYVARSFKNDELTQKWTEKALRLKPGWGLAAQMKASLLQRQDKGEERSRYIKQFLENHPTDHGMRINYAADLAQQKLFPSALEQMQIVLENDGNNAAALNYAAALANQLQKTDQAKNYYKQALALDSKNDEARWALARYAIQDENYLQAERHYQQIESPSSYFGAQLQVANMRYHTEGLESAIDVLRALEPKTEAEYVERATTRHYLLLQGRKYDEAFSAINEALTYLPDNIELVYARALVAAELSELKTAESDLRSIIIRYPDHANALNALGYTLADQTDRYAEAKELILKALELRPNDAHILDSMGWVLFRLKDFEQAIEFLQRAYDAAPEVEVAAHLGEVLWESGEMEKARGVWADAIAKDDENPLLLKTLERYGVSFTDKAS